MFWETITTKTREKILIDFIRESFFIPDTLQF
jgi:hypothetical protein